MEQPVSNPSATLTPPIKYHGGKHYLAARIVALMPPHTHYVEPFFGGGSVMLAKDPQGVSEVANDIYGDLMNFWTVLQHEDLFPEFVRACEATPFAEGMWTRALDGLRDYTSAVGRAWSFFVLCRQSLAGRMDTFAPLSRTRTRRGMNEQASAWLGAVEGLPLVHARLKRVVMLNRSAVDVIRQQDGEGTLFYCDPPYLCETRSAPAVYTHEMTKLEHMALLEALCAVKGNVMLSGYDSPLYASWLKEWARHTFDLPNNAAGGASKQRKTECLWCNF